MSTRPDLHSLLGDDADALLGYTAKAFPAEDLVLPGPDFSIASSPDSDRNPAVLRNLGTLYNHGRLGGTGYISILPVDQGIEHSAAASFAKNPAYFDPAQPARAGPGRRVQRRRHHAGHLGTGLASLRAQDPLHREAQSQRLPALPDTYDQIMFSSVRQAADLGAVGVGATIYFGPRHRPPAPRGRRGLRRGPPAGAVHRPVVLPAQLGLQEGRRRLPGLGRSHRPGQPPGCDHRGRHHQAEAAREQRWLQRPRFGKTDPLVYDELTTDHPIDLTRWQVVNCYAGRIGLINSGGESKGTSDLAQAVRTAVINKRAGARASSWAARPSSARWTRVRR